MKLDSKIIIRWIQVILWLSLIFALSHQSYSGRATETYLHEFNVPVRKLGHIVEHLVLYILILRAIAAGNKSIEDRNSLSSKSEPKEESKNPEPDSQNRHSMRLYLLALGLTICAATLDEWHQSFVPGRSASYTDVLVDSLGAALGLLICLLLGKRILN